MWIDVRFGRDALRTSSRCPTAAEALRRIGELAAGEPFYAVDITGLVLSRNEVAARANLEDTSLLRP